MEEAEGNHASWATEEEIVSGLTTCWHWHNHTLLNSRTSPSSDTQEFQPRIQHYCTLSVIPHVKPLKANYAWLNFQPQPFYSIAQSIRSIPDTCVQWLKGLIMRSHQKQVLIAPGLFNCKGSDLISPLGLTNQTIERILCYSATSVHSLATPDRCI